jgi:capsular exopolysaccharide synthesis family protein
MLHQRLQTYGDNLSRVNVEIASVGAELQNLDKIRKENGDILSLPRFGQDPDLQFLSTQKLGLEREIQRLATEKKPQHPDALSKASELEKINQRMGEQVAAIEGKLRSQYEVAKSNAASLQERIRTTEESAYQVKQKSSEYEVQKSDSDAKRKVYDIVSETVQRLSISAQLISMNNNIQVLDRAIAPNRPVAPRKVLSLAIGALLGLLAGAGVVLFMDYLDNTVRSPEDIEQHLGLSMLGVLPKYKDVTSAAAREAFQSLRTSVLFSSHNRERRVLLLTSSGPQEGKSSTVASLARTLAGSGDRVVVMDCDLRRPTQHVHHGTTREPGITNYLVDGEGKPFAAYLHGTAVPTLKLMSCGPIPPNPPDLIGSDSFRKLVADLRAEFDWVLIDSPPVAGLADAVVLATVADMVAFVVKHNHNDRQLIRRCLKQLRGVNALIVGAILNGVDLSRTYHKNYYYAGYHYAPDGEEGTSGRRADGAKKDRTVAL